MTHRSEQPVSVRVMLGHNALAGWEFLCPGPEIHHPDGGHTHQPHWRGPGGEVKHYATQQARGIVWP